MADARTAPSATGVLEQRPLVHLLVYVRNKRLTGDLELRTRDGASGGTIMLWRGRICGVKTMPPVEYFGAIAYELGRIDAGTQNATLLEVAQQRRLHGEILVEKGAITREQRDQILFEQTCRKVQHLFRLPTDTAFAFYEARPSVDEPPFSIDPIAPVWRGFRERPAIANVREVLGASGATTLKMVNEGPLGRAGFAPDEKAVVDALAMRPMSITDLKAMTTLSADRVDLLVYLLVITKCAEVAASSGSVTNMPKVGSAPPPSMTHKTPPPPTPAKTPPPPPPPRGSFPSFPGVPGPTRRVTPAASPATYSFRVPTSPTNPPPSQRIPAPRAPVAGPSELGAAGVIARAQAIESEDFFAALGLPDGASEEAARQAYIAQVRLWHPDKLPPELQHLRAEAEKIFNHLSRAHAMLTDRDARRVWVAARAAKQRSKRPRAEVISEIDKAMARRDFARAEEDSRSLAEADPEDGEAQAFLAWSTARAGEGGPDELKTALGLLDKAVNRDGKCLRAYLYRAMLHKQMGNTLPSLRDYQRVVQLDPGHVEAKREVRILEMRLRK